MGRLLQGSSIGILSNRGLIRPDLLRHVTYPHILNIADMSSPRISGRLKPLTSG
ncbi:hypothetical protein SAMN02745220_03536 [Desulfopila aestuarii DSM 18488]|uniref:Uncharacterized protein n=1 Tax=Desulfopila aestuarii DSM 18488 TaxID=1121416 RepID=A0A1M7YD98_9BACT|nr:hypothetical protein SAMN02745220_03536 [Desulfopila aestuarii DSM 18488]